MTGEQAAQAMLNPTLLSPSSAADRQTALTFPVHASIVLGEGPEGCIAYGRLSPGQQEHSYANRIKLVLQGSLASDAGTEVIEYRNRQGAEHVQIDVNRASEALDLFRRSATNALDYERGWFRAQMPQLLEWVRSQYTAGESNEMKPAVRTLAESVLNDARSSITNARMQLKRSLDTDLIPQSTKQSLSSALDVWAERANRELRDHSAIAFASRSWRTLSWWKLFWRIDDLSMVMSDILKQYWLTDAEKGIVYLSGRVEEAGYRLPEKKIQPPTDEDGGRERFKAPATPDPGLRYRGQKAGSLPPSQTLSDIIRMRSDTARATADATDALLLHTTGTSAFEGARPPLPVQPGPWPCAIGDTRVSLHLSTIPAVHAQAQALLVGFFGTSAASAALGALLAVPSITGIYEAGAVALVGVVWATRRLQRGWEIEREKWEDLVRESGREVIRESERAVRETLEGQKKKSKGAAEEEEKVKGDEDSGEKVKAGNVTNRQDEEAKVLADATAAVEIGTMALKRLG